MSLHFFIQKYGQEKYLPVDVYDLVCYVYLHIGATNVLMMLFYRGVTIHRDPMHRDIFPPTILVSDRHQLDDSKTILDVNVPFNSKLLFLPI